MAAALSAEFGRRKSDPAAFTEEQLSAGAYDKMAVGGIAETAVYDTILATLADGRHGKLNDMYAHTGFSRAKISVYLKNLMELELVEKGAARYI